MKKPIKIEIEILAKNQAKVTIAGKESTITMEHDQMTIEGVCAHKIAGTLGVALQSVMFDAVAQLLDVVSFVELARGDVGIFEILDGEIVNELEFMADMGTKDDDCEDFTQQKPSEIRGH
jgi:hypothetical protein